MRVSTLLCIPESAFPWLYQGAGVFGSQESATTLSFSLVSLRFLSLPWECPACRNRIAGAEEISTQVEMVPTQVELISTQVEMISTR